MANGLRLSRNTVFFLSVPICSSCKVIQIRQSNARQVDFSVSGHLPLHNQIYTASIFIPTYTMTSHLPCLYDFDDVQLNFVLDFQCA